MPKGPYGYLLLEPTKTSRLDFEGAKDFLSYLSQQATCFSLIIRSSQSGLENIVALPKPSMGQAKKHLYSLCPGICLKEVGSSYLIDRPTLTATYRFKKHYAYPLVDSERFDQSDLFKLSGYLSQLPNKESLEIVFDCRPKKLLSAWVHQRRLLNNRPSFMPDHRLYDWVTKLLLLSLRSIGLIINLIFKLILASEPNVDKRPKVVSPKDIAILDKLYEPLYKTSLTINIKAASRKRAQLLASDIASALNDFALNSGYQQYMTGLKKDIYSASDLSGMFHHNQIALNAGLLNEAHFKSLPAQKSLNEPEDARTLTLGFNNFGGREKPIYLKYAARQRHLYICGATGSGKSTLLANLALQDISNGQGLTLIDPHGDLAIEIMARIPSGRLQDVIYLDPSLANCPGFNLLEIKAKPGTPQYGLECEQLIEGIISLFRKLYSFEDMGGHRLEYILRNAIKTSLKLPNANLTSIYRLLTDSSYRLKALSYLDDQDLINFWQKELGRAGAFQQVKMTAGVTAKLGRLIFSDVPKRFFAERGRIDLAKIMAEQKVLICNFAKGKIGEDNSRLLATAALTKLELAALARASEKPQVRADHFVYIDEFQHCAPSIVIQMLSEVRKYGLYLTMAEQSPSQQESQATNVILANSGNLLCFRLSSSRDERLILPNYNNYLSADDLNSLPAYCFYFKTAAEEVSRPTSGQTYPTQGSLTVTKESAGVTNHGTSASPRPGEWALNQASS